MSKFIRWSVQALWILTLTSCATAISEPGTAAYNRIVAQRVFDEILNQGRYALFDEIYVPDFVKHTDGTTRNLAEEIEDAKYTRSLSVDLVLTVDQMIAEGQSVAIRYTGRGTNTGPLGSVPATGRRFVVHGMTVYRFSGGKIAEEWTVYNEADLMRQLGLAAR